MKNIVYFIFVYLCIGFTLAKIHYMAGFFDNRPEEPLVIVLLWPFMLFAWAIILVMTIIDISVRWFLINGNELAIWLLG